MPVIVPSGSARAGERTSSAAWRRAFDAEVEPQAEVQRGDDAEPAVGQAGEQLRRLQHLVGPRANGREQHDDREDRRWR